MIGCEKKGWIDFSVKWIQTSGVYVSHRILFRHIFVKSENQ